MSNERWCAGTFYRIAHKRLHLYVLDVHGPEGRAEWTGTARNAMEYGSDSEARDAVAKLHPIDRDGAMVVHVNVVRRGRYRKTPPMLKPT